MKPPYKVTERILTQIAEISEQLGVIKATHLSKPPAELRKRNRIKTIQSSLEIEGNTLTIEQVTTILENKRVIAPQKDILEVTNAIQAYDEIKSFKPDSLKELQRAHKLLMQGLVTDAGSFRAKNVGIVKGSVVAHVAPDGAMVNGLMKDLFTYLKTDKDIPLIKSCVFHYELEFIHPFADGNGRMGRLWQTVILMQHYPVFEYLPVEQLIKEHQADYYKALNLSDKAGNSTLFIEFMLGIIAASLKQLLQSQNRTLTVEDRMELFKEQVKEQEFSRKDYLQYFRELSAATASRDLKWAVNNNMLIKIGDKRMTTYRFTL